MPTRSPTPAPGEPRGPRAASGEARTPSFWADGGAPRYTGPVAEGIRTPSAIALALVASVAGAAGCERPPVAMREVPSHALAAPVVDAREEALRRARFDLARLGRDLERQRPPPDQRPPARCPDALLRGAGGDPTVVLRVRDQRADRRQLVPLSVMRAIAPDELEPLRATLGVDLVDRAPGNLGALSTTAIGQARASIAELGGRPYVAELRLSAYAEPRLTRRLGAARSEWVPGILAASITVYDRRDDTVRCQAPLLVRSRVADAPVSVRLRPATRERLIDELAAALHTAGAKALAAMSDHLRWPSSTPEQAAAGDRLEHRSGCQLQQRR